jgi:hypothetical protein
VYFNKIIQINKISEEEFKNSENQLKLIENNQLNEVNFIQINNFRENRNNLENIFHSLPLCERGIVYENDQNGNKYKNIICALYKNVDLKQIELLFKNNNFEYYLF